MKNIVFFFSFFLIYGCSNDSMPASNQISQIPDPEIPLFNPNPIILEDGVSYYSQACNNPSFQFLIPVHINDDNFVDFIAHFWCDSETPAEISYKKVPDSLVAYLSDSYGNYVISNQEIFNELYPKLGGASRKYARGDINGDGKDDFAFAMNAEDGRAAFDQETIQTNYANPAILLSKVSGYEVIKLGKKDWGHSVQIKNEEALFGGHKSQAFKYQDSNIIDISETYEELSFASFLVYEEYIINSVRKNGRQGLELVRDNEIISSAMKEEAFKVYFETWNNEGTGNYEQIGVYKYRNEYYFDGMTSEMCRKDDLIVATVNASKPNDREIIENAYYSQKETTPEVFFTFYKIENDKLLEKNVSIIGEETNHNYNYFSCFDVNQDNKKDLVAQVFSQAWNEQSPNNKGIPEIYINSDSNEYHNLDTSNWPVFSENDDSQGYLYDVNNDGLQDLIMYPLKANFTANVEIYLSNKNIAN
jgi:hypothetical protein